MADRVHTTATRMTVDNAKLRPGMRQSERIIAKSSRNMQRELSRVESPVARMGGGAAARGARTRGIAGAMGGVGQTLKGAAAFGGVYGIANELKKAKQFEEVLVDTAVRGGKTKMWMDRLRGSMISISNEFGIGKEQLSAYVGTIIDQTGNTKLATETLRDMAAVAYSANVPMGELAGTVVEMQSKLALAPKDFTEALGVLASQADKGKVPLNQMSKYLPEVLNATTQFGHTGIGALRDYGAVLQMAARGAGSLAEANTAMNRMLDQTAAKRGKIEKALGIKLKKNGAWLQLGPMLKEIVAGLLKMKREGKDVEKFIVKTWGIRGKKAMLPMLQQGMTGWGRRVGADASGAGGLTSFNALVATGGAGTIADRVARKRKLSPELDAWNRSVEKLKNKLHTHLLPALKKLGDLMPQIGKALEWMIDNWRTLLAIWAGGKMVKFLGSLRAFAGGGGGLGGLLGGLGRGAATAGAGGVTTGAAGAVGGGGLLGGLTAATAALGGFTAAMAPAIAGLHELGKGYTKEGRKETRKKLLKGAPQFRLASVAETYRRLEREKLEREGLRTKGGGAFGGGGWRGGTYAGTEVRARRALGVSRTESKRLVSAFMDFGEGKDSTQTVKEFGLRRIQKLQGASEYQLGQAGLNKEIVRTLSALAIVMEKDLRMTTDQLKKFVETHAKGITVKVVDPNKTPAAVTDSRRNAK